MSRLKQFFAIASLALAALPFVAFAQAPSSDGETIMRKIAALPWKSAPDKGDIAGKATINLDGGLRYLDAPSTSEFLTLQGNLPRPNTYTVASRNLAWFSVFKFVDEGYVQDDEKIDADALLKALKENNQMASEERRKRNLPGLFLEGWFIPPRYDTETKRLEWATLLRTDSGEKVVNFSTKILGRRGHMDAILVSDPANLDADIKDFKGALKTFDYVPGERYSEWKQGEKVAAYGLGALILGGAAAVATKKGFWAVLGGFLAAGWKLIAGVGVAIAASIGKLFRKKES